ncbi:MAG: RNA polymerase sigma factor [Bacteroidia bacterium]
MNAYHKSESDIQQELLQVEAAKKDPLRFGVLYDRYYKQVFIFIHRRTENEELAADLTSQVFLKALINIKKYVFKGVPFSAWLFRIAFNEINMYFRKNKAQRVVSLDQPGLKQMAQDVESEGDPEAVKRMMTALKRLDATDLQMIELRFFEKRSFAEVGEISGITENNAKVKVYRILDKIRKLMGNRER